MTHLLISMRQSLPPDSISETKTYSNWNLKTVSTCVSAKGIRRRTTDPKIAQKRPWQLEAPQPAQESNRPKQHWYVFSALLSDCREILTSP